MLNFQHKNTINFGTIPCTDNSCDAWVQSIHAVDSMRQVIHTAIIPYIKQPHRRCYGKRGSLKCGRSWVRALLGQLKPLTRDCACGASPLSMHCVRATTAWLGTMIC